jgi:hypothetical protein
LQDYHPVKVQFGIESVIMSAVVQAAKPAPSVAQMGAAGLRACARIAQAWGLSTDEQRRLLGEPPRSTFFAWRKAPAQAALPRDTLERLSLILGIYKSLQILLPDAAAADGWVRKGNAAFGGSTALAVMLGGNVGDLLRVRRWLDAARGGGWA